MFGIVHLELSKVKYNAIIGGAILFRRYVSDMLVFYDCLQVHC